MLDFKSLKHRIKPYPPYSLIKLRKKLKENHQGRTTLVLCFGTVHSNKKKERKPGYDPGHNHDLKKNQGVTLVLSNNKGDYAFDLWTSAYT